MQASVVSLLFHDVYERDPSESGFVNAAADRYKLSLAEFESQLAALASAGTRPVLVHELTKPGDGIPIVITVDDGGISFYTAVAHRLEALGWRGHCFVTAGAIGQPGFLDRLRIRDLRARGHVIGSHSMSHPSRFAACGPSAMRWQWEESRKILEDVLGEAVTVASVPGGYFSPAVARAAAEAGLKVLFSSEPETRTRMIAGCLVLGRFIVRRGCAPDFAQQIAMQGRSAMFREWSAWNAKKVAKALLGPAYPWLAERVARWDR
jgi:peptidoglycan/xylan/chitin deacetylase (PgdA/CDA1 family)